MEILDLKGSIIEVMKGTCQNRIDRLTSGIRLILETNEKQIIPICLGPEDKAPDFSSDIGKYVQIKAVHKDGGYLVLSIEVDKLTIFIRDNNLKPVWAGMGCRKNKILK